MMLSVLSTLLVPLGMLAQGVAAWRNEAEGHEASHAHSVLAQTTTVYDVVTVFNTTTVGTTKYLDVTVNRTHVNTIEESITEATTTTFHYTVWVTHTAVDTITVTDTDRLTITDTATDSTTVTNTETDSVTVTDTDTDSVTVTNTKTDSVTITNTDTDSVTITNTATTTTTVPTTTYTTRTVFSTTYDPCPKSCSISVETVNLYYWPTNRPYTYPTTYVDSKLGYTFTSPSVYMLIPTAVGINTAGERVGPSTASWLLPLQLSEVSTIAPAPTGNVTRQLTLADLGTDCPQTAEPTAIATLVDARCDPVLAAPSQVRSWAYPCNACGRFGLFDPPYAIPTLTGGLVESTTTVVVVPPPTVTSGLTLPASTVTGVVGGSTSDTGASQPTGGSGSSGSGTAVSSVQDPGETASRSVGGGGSSTTSAVTTAAAARVAGVGAGAVAWLVSVVSIAVAMAWL